MNILPHHFIWRSWNNLFNYFKEQAICSKYADSAMVPKSFFQEEIPCSDTIQKEDKKAICFSKVFLI